MPTTRSAAKHTSLEEDVQMMTTAASPDMNGVGHSYATRSRTRSLSDSMCEDTSSPTVKFPFFDQANSSATKDFLTPSRHSNSLEWDALSPIAKSRGSDASEVGEIEVEDNDSPRFSGEVLPQAQSPKSSIEPPSTGETEPTPMETDSDAKVPDLESARQKVGQSSHEFIERIRTAALRRKMIMTRSRDQLLAKEKEQLETNAKSKAVAELAAAAAQLHAPEPSSHESNSTQPTTNSNFIFKARPLPPTTGNGGSGGLEGVPKVEKKPITTPCSPLLGPRRKDKVVIKALQAPKIPSQRPRIQNALNVERPPIKPPKSDSDVPIKPFKARPIPPSVGPIGNAGQSGVPRVAKRPATVATSPLLGPRRRSRSLDSKTGGSGQKDNFRAPHSQAPVPFAHNPSPLSSSSPMLHGLKLVETPVHHDYDFRPNVENTKPRDQNMKPYELRSTQRAKQRAAYDLRRDRNLERKAEEGKQNREKEIQRMRRELRVMGQKL